MKLIFPLFLALALTACATTATAPAQQYRASDSAASLAISGSLVQTEGFFTPTNEVSILINGQRVTGGEIVGGATEFHGTFDGRPVLADCAAVTVSNFWKGDRVDVKCSVSVSGQRAAAFVMVPN